MSNRGGVTEYQDPLLDDLNPPVSHIYKISTRILQELFRQTEAPVFNEELLVTHGGVKGILKKLASEAGTGIVGDEKDLKRRKRVFGENLKP